MMMVQLHQEKLAISLTTFGAMKKIKNQSTNVKKRKRKRKVMNV